MMMQLHSSRNIRLSYKVSIRIGLIIFCIGLGAYRGTTTAAYDIQDNDIWRGDDDDNRNNRKLIEEKEQQYLREAARFEAHEIQNHSLWREESDVWGAMHLEKELDSGWTPASYPNPEFDPDSCGISPMMRGNGGTVDFLDLYLCDPDTVVNDRDFGRIAAALKNFTVADGGVVQGIDGEPTKHSHRDYESKDTNYRSLRGLASQQVNSPWEFVHTDDSVLQNLDESYYRRLLVTTNTESDYITQSSNTTLYESYKYYSEGLRPNDKYPRYEAKKENDRSLGSFLPLSSGIPPDISVGVAIAQKIDVTDILREYSFYSFENEVETIDDAAEYFARYLLNLWWRPDTVAHNSYTNGGTAGNDKTLQQQKQQQQQQQQQQQHKFHRANSGVLIFMSIEERVCFISAGSDVSYILPWWRLEDIVNGMKANLRNGNYADAILSAINEVSAMIDSGPPTASERAHDFLTRFGFVIVFSMVTFILALAGEYRDRRKRLTNAENRSRLTSIEVEKAKQLQYEFKATECPICLEPFINEESKLVRADIYGIPLYGSDGYEIKILRCGHIFDFSCWRAWVDADYSNANKCPFCRQDVAGLDDEFSCTHSNQSSYILSIGSNVSSSASDVEGISISASDSSSAPDIFAHYSGREYETSADIPFHSYGSTWTSSSETRSWDFSLPH